MMSMPMPMPMPMDMGMSMMSPYPMPPMPMMDYPPMPHPPPAAMSQGYPMQMKYTKSEDKCMMVMNVCDIDEKNIPMKMMMKKMKGMTFDGLHRCVIVCLLSGKESMKEVMSEMIKKQKKSYMASASGRSKDGYSRHRDIKDMMKEAMAEVMKDNMHLAMMKNMYQSSD